MTITAKVKDPGSWNFIKKKIKMMLPSEKKMGTNKLKLKLILDLCEKTISWDWGQLWLNDKCHKQNCIPFDRTAM